MSYKDSGRKREFLYPKEIELLCKGAKYGGNEGARDHALIWLAQAHGLRCSEIVNLEWSHIDFDKMTFNVHRLKHGQPSMHELSKKDADLLKIWRRRQSKVYGGSILVFTSQRRTPLTRNGIYKIVQRAGERAKFPWRVHPHMLRHTRGFVLANTEIKGQPIPLHRIAHYMGHKNLNTTLGYTSINIRSIAGFESIEYKG